MKKGRILIGLGAAGIVQYAYFQLFTKLAFNYEFKLVPEYVGGMQIPMVRSIATRDLTVGVGGAAIGIVLLILGINSIRNYKRMKARES